MTKPDPAKLFITKKIAEAVALMLGPTTGCKADKTAPMNTNLSAWRTLKATNPTISESVKTLNGKNGTAAIKATARTRA